MILNSTRQATLQAAANRIIPADDYPNAWDGGVGLYLEHQLTNDLSRSVPTYEAGLAALDAESQTNFGKAFAALSDTQQDDQLRRVEAGDVQTAWTVPPPRFFNMLVQHVCEGYYCDPMNRGNVGLRSWQMVGFEPRCD